MRFTIETRSMPTAFRLAMEFEGHLDAARMQRAVNALLRRHANLRAAFRQETLDRPVQVIVRDVVAPWREEDLSTLDSETQDIRRRELLAADLAQRFEPAKPPLLRVACCVLARSDTSWCSPTTTCCWTGGRVLSFLASFLLSIAAMVIRRRCRRCSPIQVI